MPWALSQIEWAGLSVMAFFRRWPFKVCLRRAGLPGSPRSSVNAPLWKLRIRAWTVLQTIKTQTLHYRPLKPRANTHVPLMSCQDRDAFLCSELRAQFSWAVCGASGKHCVLFRSQTCLSAPHICDSWSECVRRLVSCLHRWRFKPS